MHPISFCQFLIFFGLLEAYVTSIDKTHKGKEAEKNQRRADLQIRAHKQLKTISKHLLKTLDTSCKQIQPPAIKNGKLFKMKKRKSEIDTAKKLYLVAEFKCHAGFVFGKSHSGKMFCSRSKWIGKLPVCEPVSMLDTSGYLSDAPIENNDTIPGDDEDYEEKDYDEGDYDDEGDYEDEDYEEKDKNEPANTSKNRESEIAKEDINTSESKLLTEVNKNNSISDSSGTSNPKFHPKEKIDSKIENGEDSESYDDEYEEEDYEDYKEVDENNVEPKESTSSTTTIMSSTTSILSSTATSIIPNDSITSTTNEIYNNYDENSKNDSEEDETITTVLTRASATPTTLTATSEIVSFKPEAVIEKSSSELFENDDDDSEEATKNFLKNDSIERKNKDLSSYESESTTNEVLDRTVNAPRRIDTELDVPKNIDEYEEGDYDEYEEGSEISTPATTTTSSFIISSPDSFNIAETTDISSRIGSENNNKNKLPYNRHNGISTNEISKNFSIEEVSTQYHKEDTNTKIDSDTYDEEEYDDEDYDEEYDESTTISIPTTNRIYQNTGKPSDIVVATEKILFVSKAEPNVEEENVIRRYDSESASKRFEEDDVSEEEMDTTETSDMENNIFNNHNLKGNNNSPSVFTENRNANEGNLDEISTTTMIPTEAASTNEIPITTKGSSEIISETKEIKNRNDVNYNHIYDDGKILSSSNSSVTHQDKDNFTYSRDFGNIVENASFNQSQITILYDTTTEKTSAANENLPKKIEKVDENEEYDDDDYDEEEHPGSNNKEDRIYDEIPTTIMIPTETSIVNEIPTTTKGSWDDLSEIDSEKETENRNDVNDNDIYDDDYYEEKGDTIPSSSNSNITNQENDKPTDSRDLEKIVENASFNQSNDIILYNTTTAKTSTADENSLKKIEKNNKDEEYDDDDDDDDYDEENKEESMVVEKEVDKCEDGYILDQNDKCADIDECNPDVNPCSDICENTMGSYICRCSNGYKLSSADIHVCQDIDECLENPCSHICKNLEGSYRCDCPTGLSLQNTTSCVNLTCSHGETKINGKLQCTCPSGYVLGFDNRTCEDVDECLLFNDCSHNCQNNAGSYSCSCREGFILENGKICVDIDECQGRHGCSQVCENTPGSFKCSCQDGYEHDMLTNSCVDIDECDARRDLDECNQICINYNGGYECGCRSGFKLASDDSTCEDVDECSLNNGNCSHICTNLQGSFTCECKQNYILERDNKTCTIVDPCLEQNGGCSHQCMSNNGMVECRCPLGHILEDKECFLRDPCVVDNGKCSHICVNANGAVRCECPQGFELKNQSTCDQINPCTRNNGNCSHFCEFVDGHVNCLCPELYYLQNATHCAEINPCSENNGGCSHSCHFENHRQTCSCPLTHELHNQTYCFEKNPCYEENGGCSDICVFSNGTLSCDCPENYYLEGKICYRIDPCLMGNGGCSHECFSDEDGHVQCSCPVSLQLQTDGKSCTPTDPCLLNNGNCSHICESTGPIKCSCPEGYILRNSTHCIEVDPCSINNGGCSDICENDFGKVRCSCPDHHNLVNKTTCLRVNPCFINNGGCSHECATEGNKVICLCREGYHLEGKQCLLINPCDHKNGGCSHICSSINGQVVCKCPPDFELINKTCFKINPCLINNGECSHGCTNIKGFAKCTCPPGYKLFGKKCMDEDPCVKNNGGCSHTCRNKEGKRECSCPSGYLLRPNRRVCKEVNECRVDRGGCSHGCKNLPGSYQCTCPHGLKLDNSRNKTCIDIDECQIDNGKCEMICRNFKGGHKCDCPEGYVLQRDRRSCRLGNAEQCRVPSPPKNGILRCLDHRADYGSFVPSGTKCNAYCNEGYKLMGQSQRLCNSAGTWENGEPRCVVATCPKLPPIQNGWYLPGVCNSGRTYPGESCEIYCRKGFIAKQDIEKYVCDSNMQWMPNVRPEQLKDACVRNLPDVNIRCPKNGHIEFILPPGQRHTFVKIPKPETNIDWNFVTSQPSWATRLENTLPAGRTEVRFTAVSPSDFNSSASCHLVINVLDKELPNTMGCPENLERTIGKDEHMQIVHWREPEFHDNVGIATVYKSREPGSEFGLGLHHITYVASDEAGNRAFCHFSISIRDDLQSEESNIIKQHPSIYTNHQTAGKYRAVLICPSGVQYMSSPPDNYNNMLTSEAGCYWRHVKVTRPMEPQSFKVPPRVYSESRLPDHSRRDRRVFFKWSR